MTETDSSIAHDNAPLQAGAPEEGVEPDAGTPPRGERTDLLIVAGLALGVLGFFLLRYPVAGLHYPLGPDSSVYLWWTRLASVDGLSAVGQRPGVPALVLALASSLHLSQAQVLAGLGGALGACAGLAAAALVRAAGTPRATVALAGGLAGTFSAYLAGGYFANLAFAVLFLAAAAVLAIPEPPRPAAVAAGAALLLSAGGLAHPIFFLLAAGILALTIPFGRKIRNTRPSLLDTEAGRIGAAIAGAVALVGVGLLALLSGPGPQRADTSQDAFLRRSGLGGTLRREYFQRIAKHWARYVLPVSIPLAWYGRREVERGFLRRFVRAYGVVIVGGLIVSLVTGWFPAERFLAFGFVIPIAGALGLERLRRKLAHRGWAATAAVLLLAGAIVAGAMFTWSLQHSYITEENTFEVATAGRIAEQAPPGTPLVFIVNEQSEQLAAFRDTKAGNVIRASLPPNLIRNVFLYVGTPADYLANRPTITGFLQKDALSRTYLSDLQSALRGNTLPPLVFLLKGFNYDGYYAYRKTGSVVAPGVLVIGRAPSLATAAPAVQPVNPSEPWILALAGLESFALLAGVGYGWARASTGSGTIALALSPAFGVAAVVIGTIAAERLGMPLTGTWPAAVSALAGLGGYLALYLGRHRLEREVQPGAPA